MNALCFTNEGNHWSDSDYLVYYIDKPYNISIIFDIYKNDIKIEDLKEGEFETYKKMKSIYKHFIIPKKQVEFFLELYEKQEEFNIIKNIYLEKKQEFKNKNEKYYTMAKNIATDNNFLIKTKNNKLTYNNELFDL